MPWLKARNNLLHWRQLFRVRRAELDFSAISRNDGPVFDFQEGCPYKDPTINQLVRKPRGRCRNKVPTLAELPAAPRRLHARTPDPEEANSALRKVARAPDQRLRSRQLHRRRRPQPAGTLGGADPRRSRQDLPGVRYHIIRGTLDARASRTAVSAGPQQAEAPNHGKPREKRTHVTPSRSADKREILPDRSSATPSSPSSSNPSMPERRFSRPSSMARPDRLHHKTGNPGRCSRFA